MTLDEARKMKDHLIAVQEAREKGICRICKASVRAEGQPLGWELNYGKRVFLGPSLTLNFGEEFAHTECLRREKESADAKPTTTE